MGDTQSAQRESKEDAVAEEQSSRADDVQTEQTIEDTDNKPLQNNGQISGMKGKAAEADGHCEDEVVVVGSICFLSADCDTSSALVSPEENVPETEEPLKEEETPLENVEINEKESPDADESEPSDITETEAKLNEINEGFKKFFNNIGLKFTVKKGSGEKVETASDVPIETNEGEPSSPDDVKETTKETISENAEQNIDPSMVYETADNDSTTCPTLTDMTSEDLLENIEEKNTGTTEGKEEDASDKVVEALATSTPVGEEEKMPDEDNMPEKELDATSPTAVEEEVISPIKRFFTTGIFSGLRKKKKPADNDKANEINETTEKDVAGIEKQEALEKTGETEQDQQQVKDFRPDIETATGDLEQKENVLKEEILPATRDTNLSPEGPEMRKNAPEEKSPSREPSKGVSEPEILSSQEKVKVQGSPLKRLLSGSSFKKLSKKQRDKKSSDQKLTDSGEQLGDQLSLSAESAKHQREESPLQSHGEVAAEEDGTWASFKKLVTPKKHIKKASPSNEEAVITGSTEEPKPSDGEQISDASTEETKKRKDSSVSWDAFLCGSGKKRSRKTSDSEDETPRIEGDGNRSDGEARHSAGSPIESSNEGDELVACFPEQAESPSEGDGGSTWKSLKKLVTPKRKAKDEEESKDNIPSDSESNKTDSSFSIKKLLPGRKKRKPTEKQEQGSSDEADKEVGSDDEDSETPAVVPLSEFDTFEREDQVQIQAVIENHMPKAVDFEPQQDLADQITEPALPSDSPPTEPQKVQGTDNASGNQASATPASNEEHDDQTEFISKYQQLSDIPEEGVIEESVATPVSFTEEAPRDDTIAEDLIELTSEAITAPEPVDVTLADETEMVSAVSQLTDSSKTSGNTTPVPAEYDVKETETLLHQVVETISTTPNAELVCSNEVRTEQIVSSFSPQILETAAQQEATILTLHQTVDATVICTGVTAKEFDAVNVLAATAQMESASEVSEVMSTEALSELTTEEFDTAEIAVDEVYQANVSATQMENLPEVNEGISTEPLSELPTEEFDTAEIVVDEVYQANISQEILKEFKSNDEIQPLAECIPEANEAASTELLHEDEKIGTAQVLLDETNQAETQSPEITSHKADSNVAVTEKNENEIAAQMGEEALLQQEQIIKNDTDQVEIHDEVVEELQKSTVVLAATSQLKEESVQMIEKPILSEDIPIRNTLTGVPKHEVHLTEVNVEQEKEGDFQVVKMDPAKVEHVPVPEVSTHGVKDAMVEKERELQAQRYVEEGTVKEFEEQLILEQIPEPETDITITSVKPETESEAAEELAQTVKIKEVQIIENIIEDVSQDVKVEDEDHIPQVVDELQTLTAVNIASVNLEPNGVQVLEKQVKSEDIPAHCVDSAIASAVDEPLYEAHLSEVNVELEQEVDFQGVTMDAAKAELVPLPEVSTHDM
ncbi:A-kinase anchor protein 12 [Myripristis murdjan]|uniref:A-kinase anchor protein 12 n=1 Tax=Myripristis murdjan TaxID=586833 RepID=UPI001176179C|nr:A-kinase anchor protein 12 [Myripristis murdjan]